jgi:radical SAM protein with 4Fe4S-binding SPASM domain
MKEWLYDHRDTVVLGLSLDGTRAAHNFNRSNSYDRIEPHLSFFRDTWPFQPVKMTISPQVVDQIYEGILNIYSYGLKCSANVVYEDVWSGIGRDKYLPVFASELERLVEHFGERPSLEVPGLILDLPIQNFVAEMEKDWKWCGAGSSMKCIYVDGREFPCHRFANLLRHKSSFSGTNSSSPKKVNAKCDNCAFFYACPTCDSYNYEMNGSRNYKTDYHCELIKLQIMATAKLKYRRLNYHMLRFRQLDRNIDELAEIVNTIDSILYVAKHMDIEGYNLSWNSIPSSVIDELAHEGISLRNRAKLSPTY